ncbi:MAG: hypothetical protein JSV44_07300 [Candidatus Zixiibacteriota bacterium]|nr:MAG: hypothetical protein JSV44_07300 [candidate division Zixibacteria bacterium]
MASTRTDIQPAGWKEKAGYYTAAAVILAGIVVRFLFLSADPPLFFKGTTQALLTDPYNLTYFARNKVLFGTWDIFDYPRWEVFKYSLSSAAGYLYFTLGGVSRTSANLSAISLSLGGILFYLFGLACRSRRAAGFAGVLLLSNMTLIVYGRYPFLENGLIFLGGLLFFLVVRFYPSRPVIVATGMLAALCMLSGKAFGIIMVVPAALVIWLENRSRRAHEVFFLGLITVLSGALLTIIFYGENLTTVYHYMSEQSTGMYGFPRALTSPLTFLVQLVTLGGQSKLFCYSPFLLPLGFVSALILLLYAGGKQKAASPDRTLTFNVGWFFSGFVLLMIFNHRPLRYQLFLMLPLAGIIGTVWAEYCGKQLKVLSKKWKLLFLLLLCWYFATQLFFIGYWGNVDPENLNRLVVYSCLPAIALTSLIYLSRKLIARSSRYWASVLTVLLVAAVVFQAMWIYEWMGRRTYTLKEAGEDLRQILGHDAVVIGPYAQALTIDNDLRSFIYMFGLANKEPDLFERFPLTHLAVDLSNYGLAVRDYPFLASAPLIARYWFRDVTINIVRQNDYLTGFEGRPYLLSGYERAKAFLNTPLRDSTMYYLPTFLQRYPRSISGLVLLSDHYLSTGAIDKGLEAMNRLSMFYPENFSFYFDHGFKQYKLYKLTGNEDFLNRANRLFDQAVELNPYIVGDVARAKSQVDSLL